MSELRECPFCGGKPRYDFVDNEDLSTHTVSCCGCGVSIEGWDEADTWAQWNRRPPAIDRERVNLERYLADENRAMRNAGCLLAEAAMRVVHTCDGLHRLSKAVSTWNDTIANEGGRAALSDSPPKGDTNE